MTSHELKETNLVESVVSERDMAMNLFINGLTAISEAEKLMGISLIDQLRIAYVRFNSAHLDNQIERARVLIDRESWKKLIDRTSLNIYWNAPQLKSFIDELISDPPIMTIQAAREKVSHTVNNRADILCEGLVSCLGNLSHDFKKNARSFVINENMVIKNGFKKDVHYLDTTDRDLNSLNDLYRISRYIEGLSYSQQDVIVPKLFALREKNDYKKVDYIDTDLNIKFIVYGNGNIHMRFMDGKVLDGLNDVLASYQRNNLPDVK
ncbi:MULTISPECIES: DUF4942 domain-containing protein [Enterobacteriaceae]|uniref:DUF4942 domain-containing protein n=1 Tax=Enterobacteriaceae TaxID=543 RepID=UPI0005B61883|nr:MULTISPECIES: DUF4942 domain-containing protein [Enterobacteriaceae]AYB68543.1 DUF4942 domain-containing protein [Klebsiella pneumoniae]EIX9200666.1 DUF4942 domain-containing protein [Klebsiella pneumoniae]MCD6945204.1 DUF4942 domain-containing protein [Escherichia coli]MCD6964992.1 DUF4942 domain-containing protein [Escherichia coli]MDE8914934.1 DUF4942 domain-containing protein [Klebsiella pneumoniae]